MARRPRLAVKTGNSGDTQGYQAALSGPAPQRKRAPVKRILLIAGTSAEM